MSTASNGATLRIKLTISRDEHPAMFDALAHIGNPRHRSGRLKDLVIKALIMEQAGANAIVGTVAAGGAAEPDASAVPQAMKSPSGTSVASMLDWDTSQA